MGEFGCLVQITASSVTGARGKTAQRIATWLLERNAVHVIASDAHDDKPRKPILSEARDAVSKNFGATSPKPWFLKTRQRSSLAFHFPLLAKPRETHLRNSSARLADSQDRIRITRSVRSRNLRGKLNFTGAAPDMRGFITLHPVYGRPPEFVSIFL
jgi:hypothetical protein